MLELKKEKKITKWDKGGISSLFPKNCGSDKEKEKEKGKVLVFLV